MRARRTRSSSTTCSRGIHSGAKLYVVDPRRTASAQWADGWLGLDVGSDIALANAVGREILAAGLENRAFIERATTGFDAYREAVEPYTLENAERTTGVPAELIRELAHAYARAPRAQLCWTLGITEHHNAVDNVRALINLALLSGHVGRYGSGLNPLRGQNNVQGGGDMGAIPNKFPGGQDVEDPVEHCEVRARVGRRRFRAQRGWNLTDMFDAMERRRARHALRHRREPGAVGSRSRRTRSALLRGLEHLVVQDIFLTKTGELADVVLPASRELVRVRGNGDEQRAARAALPQGARSARRSARRHRDHLPAWRERLGAAWPQSTAAATRGTNAGALSPWHAGMSYARLEELGGIQWPCYDERHPGALFLHARLWEEPVQRRARAVRGRRARPAGRGARRRVSRSPHDRAPTRFVQHRRAERRLRLAAAARRDARHLARGRAPLRHVGDGDRVRVTSRRGSVVVPVRIDAGLRAGLVFTTFHYNDDVATNLADDRRDRSEVGNRRVQGRARCGSMPSTSGRSGSTFHVGARRRSRNARPSTRSAAGERRRRRARIGISCFRRCTPCKTASAGSAAAR